MKSIRQSLDSSKNFRNCSYLSADSPRGLCSMTNQQLSQSLRQSRIRREKTATDTTKYIQIIPNWLLQRQDFQISMKQYNYLSSLDPSSICQKPQKTPVQKKVLQRWARTYLYFKQFSKLSLFQSLELLTTKYFSKGETIFHSNTHPTQYFLLIKGKVKDYSTNLTISSVNAIAQKPLFKNREVPENIVAISDITVLSLSVQKFQNLIVKNRVKTYYSISGLTKALPCLKGQQLRKIEMLSNYFQIYYLNPGTIIYNRFDSPDNMFIIQKGKVQIQVLLNVTMTNKLPVTMRTSQILVSKQEYSKTVKQLTVGNIFGHKELIQQVPRQTRATAKSQVALWYINKSYIFQVFNQQELQTILQASLQTPLQLLQTKFKKEISRNKQKMNLLFDVSDLKRIPSGRKLFVKPSNRTINYLTAVKSRHSSLVKKYLVKQSFTTDK